jgi:hypothetical protein
MAAPDIDPEALGQAIHEAFAGSDGPHPVDQLCDDWLELARQHGLPVQGQDSDPLPGMLDVVERTVCTAIWFGITTGYMTLARHYTIPRKYTGYL